MFTKGTSLKASKYGADAINKHKERKQVVKNDIKKDEFNAAKNSDTVASVVGAATTVTAGVLAYKNRGKIANFFKKENISKVTKPVVDFFKKIPSAFKKENVSKVTKPVIGFFKKIPSLFKKENIQKITKPVGEFFSKIAKNLPKLFKKV